MRMRSKKVLLAFLLSGLVLVFPINLQAEEGNADGRISGSVINGTTGEPVSDLELILRIYEGEQEKPKRRIRTDAEGEFSFSALERRKPGYTYSLKITYKEINYYSPVFVFKEEQQEIFVEMLVYEKTDSDEHISVNMHHVVIGTEEGILKIQEVMLVENAGNKVYVGSKEIAPGKKETLRISLPIQAQELRLLGGLVGSYLVETEDGFADTMGIKPGKKEVFFEYKIAYTTSNLDLVKRVYATTGSLDFLIADSKGIRAEGENIEYLGLVGESGEQYQHFSGKQLSSGTQVALHLSNFPRQTKSLKEIAPVVGIILLCLGFISPLILRRKKTDDHIMDTEQETTTTTALHKERQRILWTIADLDDQLDAGQISPEEHDKKRRLLKEKAVELTQTLQRTTD